MAMGVDVTTAARIAVSPKSMRRRRDVRGSAALPYTEEACQVNHGYSTDREVDIDNLVPASPALIVSK